MIEFIENLPGYGNDNYTLVDASEIYDFIEKQPKVGEWILTEERLPKKDGIYLATSDGEKDFQRILTWKPLPESYKGD